MFAFRCYCSAGLTLPPRVAVDPSIRVTGILPFSSKRLPLQNDEGLCVFVHLKTAS